MLLALAFYFLMTGILVPRRSLEDVKEDRDAWREAHRLSEEARQELQSQNTTLLETTRTIEELIRALPSRQQGRGGR